MMTRTLVTYDEGKRRREAQDLEGYRTESMIFSSTNMLFTILGEVGYWSLSSRPQAF
jgi:hypothetical protein